MNFFKQLLRQSHTAVNPQEAQALIKGKNPPFLLDVRQSSEFRSGHIAGAKLIPLDRLLERLDEVPKDREILCICRSGARSGIAVQQLTRAGYKARNLEGGMVAWQQSGMSVKKSH